MIRLIAFLGVTVLGFLIGAQLDISIIEHSAFSIFAALALTVGLFSSVVGIDKSALASQRWRAILIITIGVPIQILATAGLTYLFYPVVISFLVAVAIDQIDPISVETLIHGKKRMSDQAKAILRVWASFDDPVTVIFGFLILLPMVAGTSLGLDIPTYFAGLALNLIPAGILFVISRRANIERSRRLGYPIIAITLMYSFLTQSYLFAAIAGLLVRPIQSDEKKLSDLVAIIYYVITFVIGITLAQVGIDMAFGLTLALIEFFIIQPLSALIFFKGTRLDLIRIAFAQQNGLTTLLMGLAFQALGFNVLPILIPAIVFINTFNLITNAAISWFEERLYSSFTSAPFETLGQSKD